MTQWYYSLSGEESGPVEQAQLVSMLSDGSLRPDTYVWREGMADWKRAGDVSELRTGPTPPAPPAGAGGYSSAAGRSRQPTRAVRLRVIRTIAG